MAKKTKGKKSSKGDDILMELLRSGVWDQGETPWCPGVWDQKEDKEEVCSSLLIEKLP